jgi:hypothetical protein
VRWGQQPQKGKTLMSRPPDTYIKLTDTLSLCEYQNPKNGSFGFWLYDETRGMNLAMRAESERSAFVEALGYYQEKLQSVESELVELSTKVNKFIGQFTESDEI